MEGGKGAKATSSAVEPLPNLDYPESAARVLGKLARYAEWRDRAEGMILDFDDIRPQEARKICQQAIREQGDVGFRAKRRATCFPLSRFPCHPAVFA